MNREQCIDRFNKGIILLREGSKDIEGLMEIIQALSGFTMVSGVKLNDIVQRVDAETKKKMARVRAGQA